MWKQREKEASSDERILNDRDLPAPDRGAAVHHARAQPIQITPQVDTLRQAPPGILQA